MPCSDFLNATAWDGERVDCSALIVIAAFGIENALGYGNVHAAFADENGMMETSIVTGYV